MSQQQLDQLRSINRQVNELPYVAVQGHGEPYDWWTDIPVPGDSFVCRDYVLMKAKMLREAGWNPMKLQVVLCYVEPPGREYHAVLCAETDDGNRWIADSRQDDIRPFENPDPLLYTWDRQQVPGTTDFASIA
jgi:predicted transglutaminase-like cysteine proteinase